VKTRKYSTFIKRIFDEYSDDVEIFVEGRLFTPSEIPIIIEEWCKNSAIKNTIDFCVKRNGEDIFCFHDTPDNFWVSISELSFIKRLAKEKIVKYRICTKKKRISFLKKLFQKWA
jgi:L-rhamnose isomerase